MRKQKEFGLISLIAAIVVTSLVTSLTTGLIIFNNQKVKEQTDIKNDEALQQFIEVYESVLGDYYRPVDKAEMVNKAIEAMLNYLGDDYTTYMNENETKDLAEKLSGKYKGIGVEITEGNVINKVFDDSPAKEAGLQSGDVIIKIDDTDTTTLTSQDIANMIKNNNDKTTFTITVKRNEEQITVTVDKKELYLPEIESKTFENNGKKIGYLYISAFSDTIYDQFNKELKKLEEQNIDGLIIDVRSNTGGYLKAAQDIASLFLEKGKVIYSLESKNKKEVYKDKTTEKREYKVTVLINEASASASEILASALKDSYNASLVGKRSYGKGKVQQTAALTGGTMYKYTSARWLTPNGKCIDKEGLTPDYEVDLTASEDGTVVEDAQLNKAIEVTAN